MPQYKYTAVDKEGSKLKGIIQGSDSQEIYTKLKKDSLYMISCQELEDVEASTQKLKTLELSDFARELGEMLIAGIAIIKAIGIIRDRSQGKTKKIYEKLYIEISRGNTLTEAMELCEGAFPNLMINLFRAGENSGTLDQTAIKVATYYEKENRLNQKIKTATTYPTILLVVTIAVVLIIFTFVLPAFFDLFQDMELPLITQGVLAISHGMKEHGLVIIIISLLLLLIITYIAKIESVAYQIDKSKLKLPKIGRLLTIIYTARFARTLATMYSSGIPMINAVNLASTTISNRYIEGQFAEVVLKIRTGTSLSESIESVDGLDKKLKSTINIGEETGKLDSILNSIADNFDYEAETATTKLLTLIEPVMIIIMAVVIGSIMLSVMLPIIQIYQNVG